MKKLIFTSLLILGIACNPGSVEETTTEQSSGFNTSGEGQSQTSIVIQMTTSGEPNSTDSANSTETTSSNPTEVNTVTTEIETTTTETTEALSICGNNILELLEECDDGNINEWDDCSNDCLNNRTVFLTTDFIGLANFGGIEVADQFCQIEAKVFSIPGIYKAWLSDDSSQNQPKFRFDSQNFEGWYVKLDQTPIAKGWKDLTDGELTSSINIQSNGFIDRGNNLVWTATNSDGTKNISGSCGNWTEINSGSGFNVVLGNPNSINTEWTTIENSCGSEILKKLYCFQVD